MGALDIVESPPSPADSADDSVRTQRIREHHNESLMRKESLHAIVGCVAADMAELEQLLRRAVLDRFQGGTATVEEIEECKPTIDLLMRANKLFIQDCRLEGQLAKELAENSSPRPRESASEEIARCAPTRPGGCDATDGAPEASSESTPEVADA
jgi:hypothetical protein